jgi:hypothetical protein
VLSQRAHIGPLRYHAVARIADNAASLAATAGVPAGVGFQARCVGHLKKVPGAAMQAATGLFGKSKAMIPQNGAPRQHDRYAAAAAWVRRVAPLYAPLVSDTGVTFATNITPDGRQTAYLSIAPGDGLPRRHRRFIESHPYACRTASVRADEYCGRAAPTRRDFDETTLRWAIKRADAIAIWAAPFPDGAGSLTKWQRERHAAGAKFFLTIECPPDNLLVWTYTVFGWKRRAVPLKVIDGADAEQSDELWSVGEAAAVPSS